MGKIIERIEKEMLPDCCITCQEIYVQECTLTCNLDGIDVLPWCKCGEFKRLKMYGQYRSPLKLAI